MDIILLSELFRCPGCLVVELQYCQDFLSISLSTYLMTKYTQKQLTTDY